MTTNSGPQRLTTVGRTIDIHFPTNRAIVLLSLAAFAAGLATSLVRGDSLGTSATTGLAWGGALFLGWALAREADPDRWISAFFAAAGALAATLLLGSPGFLMLFWFLISLRFVSRSTGEAPGWLDLVGYCGVTLWLGLSTHWTLPLLSFPAILFAGPKRFPLPVPFLLAAVFPVTGLALGQVQQWQITRLEPSVSPVAAGIIGGTTLAAVLVMRSYQVVRSKADRTDQPLESLRIQCALAWAVSAGIILTFVAGVSLAALGPVWAALAGAGVGWLIGTLRTLRRRAD